MSVRALITVKRLHNHRNSYKEKHLVVMMEGNAVAAGRHVLES